MDVAQWGSFGRNFFGIGRDGQSGATRLREWFARRGCGAGDGRDAGCGSGWGRAAVARRLSVGTVSGREFVVGVLGIDGWDGTVRFAAWRTRGAAVGFEWVAGCA